jgi:hypothetical protein
MVLIVANELDPHADAVAAIFNARRVNFLRIDVERAQHQYDVNLRSCDDGPSLLLRNRASGRSLELKSISTVWWRRGASVILDPRLIPEATVASEETMSILRWAIQSLPSEMFPLGHPWNMGIAENKILQLRIAETLKFQIPEYIFANTHRALGEFLTSGPTIIKSLAHSGFKRGGQSFALVPKRVRVENLDGVPTHENCAFLQREISRSFDVRAFVGPNWTHACKIDLSEMPPGEVDWRMHISKLRVSTYELSNSVSEKCRRFLRLIGIPSGHFDFICDSQGELWFLECNPNGQWYWLESMAGCPIAQDVAKTLAD